MTALDKRQAQKFLLTLAVAWQREVTEIGPGPKAEYYRAQLLGALAMYREAYDVRDVSPLILLDRYMHSAWAELGFPKDEPADNQDVGFRPDEELPRVRHRGI